MLKLRSAVETGPGVAPSDIAALKQMIIIISVNAIFYGDHHVIRIGSKTSTYRTHRSLSCIGDHVNLYLGVSTGVPCVIHPAEYIRSRQGLRDSRARQILLAITLLMITISTAHFILNILYYILQFPTLGATYEDPTALLNRLYGAQACLRRVTVCFNCTLHSRTTLIARFGV